MLLVGRQEGHPAWGTGVVVCLERGADLHMAQLMPLPLTVSCFSKIQIGFSFLVPAHPGSPGQRAVKRVCGCVCVCVRVCVCVCVPFWGITVRSALTFVQWTLKPVHLCMQATSSAPTDYAFHCDGVVTLKMTAETVPTRILIYVVRQFSPAECRPRHCSKGAQPVPKSVYRSSHCDKYNRLQCDSNLGHLTP